MMMIACQCCRGVWIHAHPALYPHRSGSQVTLSLDDARSVSGSNGTCIAEIVMIVVVVVMMMILSLDNGT